MSTLKTFDCLSCGATTFKRESGQCKACSTELRERGQGEAKPMYWIKDWCDCKTPCTCLRAAWLAECEKRGQLFWDEDWLDGQTTSDDEAQRRPEPLKLF